MFKYIIRFFTILSPLLQRLGACAIAGFIAGAITGFMLWLHALLNAPPLVLSASEIIQLSLLFAFAAWLVIIFAFVVLGRVSFLSMWHTALFNSFLTCALTILVVYKLNLWIVAFLIGMIIGILVGLLLCYLNGLLKHKL
jgi:hypothetical protein